VQDRADCYRLAAKEFGGRRVVSPCRRRSGANRPDSYLAGTTLIYVRREAIYLAQTGRPFGGERSGVACP